MKNLSDNQLFERLCRDNDLSACEALFDRYWLKLFSAAKARLHDEDEAKDCVQDVFLNIWSKRETLPIPESVKAYLLISLKNKILNVLRHKVTNEKHLQQYLSELDLNSEPADPELELHELEAVLEDEISKMPEQMRRIFMLSRDEGLSGNQIAERLSLSHQTVRNQISNSLKRIRQRVLKFRSQF